MALDPMQEKERNAMRRKCADTLHALARKIENGTYDTIELEITNEIDQHAKGPHYIPEGRLTGRQTLRIFYDTKQPGKRT